MPSYTNIAKPTLPTYTGVHATQGLQIYDQADLAYDDTSVYYDSVNPSQYTDVSKPSSTVYTNIAKPV